MSSTPAPVAAFDVPEDKRLALSSDIQSQLAGLPTVIDSPDTYRKVVESLPILKRYEDKVVAFFKDIKSAAYNAHKAITAKETQQLKPIVDARARMSRLKYAYEQEQDRLKREREQAQAREEQRRREAQALAEAEALSKTSPEMADQVLEQAIAAPAPVVVLPSSTAAVEVAGVGKSKPRWVWRYRGAPDHETTWKQLSPADRAAVMALFPRQYCMPDESAITKLVTAMEGNVKIPGIEIYDIGRTSVRG